MSNLMFSLVSSRYERASLIVTSNKPFSAWGEVFGDEVAAETPPTGAVAAFRAGSPAAAHEAVREALAAAAATGRPAGGGSREGGSISTGAKGSIFGRP